MTKSFWKGLMGAQVSVRMLSTFSLAFVFSCTGIVQDRSKRNPKADYSNLGDQVVQESQNPETTELPFSVNVPKGDSPESIEAWARSSDPTIVPDPTVQYEASSGQFIVKIVPASGKHGEVEITVYVKRRETIREQKFKFTVQPVNDPPELSDFLSQTIPQDSSLTGVSFDVTDSETTNSSLLIVAATSNNQTLLPNANITVSTTGSARTLSLAPATGQSGTAIVRIRATDPEGKYSEKTFVLTVQAPVPPPAPNTAPTISDIANQTILEDASPSSISFTVGDAEQAVGTLSVTATSSNTALIPNANLVVGGSGASRSVDISGATNQNGGPVTITVTVSDGTLTATDTFQVTITPVDDAPTISAIANQTINEDSGTGALAFTVGDIETAATSLTVSGVSSNQSLVADSSIVFTGTGVSRTVAVTPESNASGSATITVTVSDGSLTTNEIFTVTVNSVNDAPTISDIANQTINEDSNTGALAITVGDTESAAGALVMSGSSSNQTLVPDGNIVFGGTGASRTVVVTPAANQFGTATITLQVSDGSLTATDTFTLTVTAVDDNPTITDIANQTVSEDTATSALAFTVGDQETAVGSLTLTGTSSDTTLIPNGNIVFGGSGASRTVVVSPAGNLSGTATITVTLNDGALTASDAFTVTVNAVNDAPAISDVANQTVNEDTDTGALAFTVSDPESAAGTLTVTGSSSNQTLVPDMNVVIGGSGASRTVTVTPAANQSGTVTVTFTVSDGTASSTDTFTLTVTAVNDAPTISDIANQSTSESTATSAIAFTVGDVETSAGSLTVSGSSSDQSLVPNSNIVFGGSGASRTVTITPASGLSGTATITVQVSDGSTNTSDTFVLSVGSTDDPPTISDVANQSTNEDTATSALAITVGDTDTTLTSLTMSGSSSNQTVVPDGNIVFGGSGANRTVTITPAANQSGSATITLTVSDGTSSTNDTFTLTVNAINDAPTISDVANQSTNEDTATSAISVTVGDLETAVGSLTLSASSSDQGVVTDGAIVLGGSGANRTVTITPVSNATGTATITLQVSDGSLTATDTFVLTVNAINDAPTISDVANQSTSEDTATSAIAVTVGDSETSAGSLTLTASSSNQSVVADGAIVLGGSGASRTVTITPESNASGTATITITVSDGSLTATDTFVLTVNAVNDAPTISDVANQSTNEDIATSAIAVTVGDVETSAGSLTLTASSSNQSVVADGAIALGGSGANRTVTITPVSNASGTATITITVSDGSLTATDTFVLTVNAVNDPPTISDVANQSTNEDTATSAIAITVGDSETAVGSLTMSGSSSSQSVVADGNIVFGGSGASRTVTITPVSNASGTATITIQVSDGTDNASDTFVLTVNAVNDAPTIGDVADQSTTEDTPTSAIAVTIGDQETGAGSLSLTGSSSNQTILPDANITIGGSGASRTVTLSPAANQSGTVTVTLTVSDGTASSTDTFTLTVTAVNDVPTISDIANQSTSESTATSAIAFTVGDVETSAGSLTVSGSSSDQSLVPNSNIVFGGSGASRTVTITPATGLSGTATITVQVSDGNLTATDSFTLTVGAVDDPPTISDVANQSTNEDTATSALAITVGDPDTTLTSLTMSGSSSNQTVVPDSNIVFGGSGANRTVTITPAANQSGSATITLTVSDGTSSTNDTFTLTVNAMNDAPTISDVANQSTNEDTATSAISLTVGDLETAAGSLTLSGSSDNQTLVSNANIVFGGSGASRTVTITPESNQTGTATITLTVSDGSLTATDTLTVTVNGVNDAPTISDVANQSTNEDTATSALAITVGDQETAVGSLTMSGSSSNQSVVADGNIVFGGTGASRTVTITPESNASGTATITITVSDGSLTATDTFVLTVNAVNDTPTISDVANQSTNEDTATSAIAVTVGDVETSAGSLTLTASSSNQSVVADGAIALGGSGASRTVTITPVSNASGTATITITVSDGSLTATDTFVLTVTGINDTPTISDVANQTINEDSSTSALAVTIGDQETAAGSLTLTGSSDNTTLIPNGNIVFGGSGSSRTVTITPAANQNGSATITLTVSDGVASATDTFTVTVTAVNDAPTVSDVANQTVNEDVATSALAFTIADQETAAASLTVTRSSSNTTLVPLANVVLGGSGASRTVTVTPAADQSGTSTITITVSDGSLSSSDTFTLTVNAVDDPPVFVSTIDDHSGNEDEAVTRLGFEVSDVDSDVESLRFTVDSSNKTLLADTDSDGDKSGTPGTITLNNEGAGVYSLDLNPDTDVNGSSIITVTEENSGINFSFTASFAAVNDTPTITDISNRTINEDANTGAIAFTIGDAETTVSSLSVTTSSSNTTLIPNANVVLGGSGASRTVTVTPAANQFGTSTITINVSDGQLTGTDTFVVTVNSVNDVPTITDIANQTVQRNSSSGALAFTIGDVETAVGSLTVTRSSSDTAVIPLANVVLGGSGASRTVTVTPAANKFGTVTITVSVSDGTATTSDTFVVTVPEPQMDSSRVLVTYPHKDGWKVSKKDRSNFRVGGICNLSDNETFEIVDSETMISGDATCFEGKWEFVFDFSSVSNLTDVYIYVDSSLKDFQTSRTRMVSLDVGYCDSSKESNSPFAAGTGTVGDPYMICTATQLNQIRNYATNHFQLRNTIDLADLGGNWTPHYFSGTFNGNDFQIKNLTVSHNSDYGGMFQVASTGSVVTIQNLHFYNVNMTSTSGYCHGPISHLWGNTHALTNVSSHTGSISAAGFGVGGIVGCVYSNATVTDAFSDLTVSTTETTTGQVGGIMGRGNVYTITRAAFMGTVTAPLCAGGVVGGGWGTGNSVIDSFSTGSVTITSGYSGAGGLMGCPNSSFTVTNSYSTGTVTGGNNIGGLFAGTGSSTVTNTYAANVMSGGTGVVGFGHDWGSNTMTSNYFDTQKAGTSNGWLGTGRTTSQLKDYDTFTGWNFAGKWVFDYSMHDAPLLKWWVDQHP
jgi:VCBS repeat-containing protein